MLLNATEAGLRADSGCSDGSFGVFILSGHLYARRAETMVGGLPRACKSVRGGVHNRDYLGLWRTGFDERPSEHVLIYSGSDGLNARSWEILCQQTWQQQGRVSSSDCCQIFLIFLILKFEDEFRPFDRANESQQPGDVLNAKVTVLVDSRGPISRNLWSA